MKCQKCQYTNDNNEIFCKNCGERLKKQKQSDIENDFNNFMNKEPEHESSCISEAWKKIKKNSNWKKQLVYCGLCNIIPILNFTSAGYSLKWADNYKNDNVKEFNQCDIVNSENLKIGFYECITFLAYCFIFLLASSIINNVFDTRIKIAHTIIQIALFVFTIIFNCFISLAVINMYNNKQLGDSFLVKEIFKKFKSNCRKLFFSYFIPSLICKGIALVIILICTFIFSGNILNYIDSIELLTNFQLLTNDSVYTIISLLFTVGLLLIIVYVVFTFMLGIERVLRYSSINIYIKRYCNKK